MLKNWIAAALALGLLGASSAPDQSGKNGPPQAASGAQTGQDTPPHTLAPPAVKAAPKPQNPTQKANSEPQEKSFLGISNEGWIALGTVGLFLATSGLWVFTALLWGETKRAVGDTKASLKLAQDEFNATHRPVLRIRHVVIGDPSNPVDKNPDVGSRLNISLIVVNSGGTKAYVEKTEAYALFTRSGLPVRSPLNGTHDAFLAEDTCIGVGESISTSMAAVVRADEVLPHDSFIPIGRQGWSVFVMGQIKYRDERGSVRFMGFCRIWDGLRPMNTVDHPDYEYSD